MRMYERFFVRPWQLLVPILAASIVMALMVTKRHASEQQLFEAITSNGGSVSPGPGFKERLHCWMTGVSPPGIFVELHGAQFTSAWLRQHDYMCDTSMYTLTVAETQLTDNDIQRLIHSHPLRVLSVSSPSFGVLSAAALEHSDIEALTVTAPEMTDAAFARLPLETIENVSIYNSQVTAHGLLQLRRCKRLNAIHLEANQLNRDVTDVLASIASLSSVSVSGGNINDEHLELLGEIRGLECVWLEHTPSVSDDGVTTLRAALPSCRVRRVH